LPFRPGNPVSTGSALAAYVENLLPDSKAICVRGARRLKTKWIKALDPLISLVLQLPRLRPCAMCA
jgi:hypothetical protein